MSGYWDVAMSGYWSGQYSPTLIWARSVDTLRMCCSGNMRSHESR